MQGWSHPRARVQLLLLMAAVLHFRMADTLLPPAAFLRSPGCKTARPNMSRRGALGVRAQDASWSPLHFAAGAGDVDAVRYFLTEGHPVDPQITSGHTPLHIAAQMGNAAVVRLLLEEAGARVDERTHDGITPLYVALQQGRIEVARILVASGADVNAKTETGNSALHMAAQRGMLEAAEVLIESGCQVNARTTRGHTPLHLAVEHRQPALAHLLLQSRAATDCSDNIGHHALHLAATLGSPELVHVLLKHGAPVNQACSRGLTPLDLAIYQGAPSACLEALLSKGAVVARHPWNNQTALDAAAFLGRREVVDMLLAHGATSDARLHLQWGDGLGERQGARGGGGGAEYLQAQAVSYLAAIRDAASQSDTQTQLAALERLGSVQARLAAISGAPRYLDEEGFIDYIDSSPPQNGAAAESFREASRLRGDGEENVASSWRLALVGDAQENPRAYNLHNRHNGRQLEDLCVCLDEPGAVARAVALWRQVCVCIHTHTHTHTHIIYIYISHTHTHIHTYTNNTYAHAIYIYIYIHTYIHTYIYIFNIIYI
jgi:ankyrin repeat protein